MFKSIFILTILLFFNSNTLEAQINTSINTFDNSKIIYSISDKQPKQLPKYYLFIKYISTQATNYYLTIHNKNGVTNLFSGNEDVKLKINGNDIYTIETVISTDIRLERQATLRFNDKFANIILNAETIEFQLPVYKERINEETTYFYLSVPNSVLEEWKQVITME